MKRAVKIGSLVLIGVFFIYAALKMATLGSSYNGVAEVIVEDAIPKTHAKNVVTAVVFDYRGYDTLGESFVLFTAITASTAVLRKPVLKVVKKKGGKHLE
jgi:multisubunit Na+/H+ antiporter MnhB subunit